MTERTTLRRQVVPSMMVVVVLVLIVFFLLRQSNGVSKASESTAKTDIVKVSDAGKSAVQIETQAVLVAPRRVDIAATGLLSFPADQNVKISPRLTGRIQQVFVRVGDAVTAGQTVAVLDSVDASGAVNTARQNDNKLRQASLNLARQERLYRLGTPDVTAAQANLDQAKARTQFTNDALTRVQEQAKIGGFTQKPLEDAQNALVAAKSTLAQARSDLAQAQRDHNRKSVLFEGGVASKSDFEASTNVLEKAQVAVQAGDETVKLAEQAVQREKKAFGTNLYADQAVRSAQSDYQQALLQQQAAERALSLAKVQILRDLEQARSDYQSAQFDAQNASRALVQYGRPGPDGTVAIKAPISGIVTERNINPGQVVDQSQMTPWQMMTISNTHILWVDADVYEKDLGRVVPGQRVKIRVGAFPDHAFFGSVLRIAPGLDSKSHAAKVRAEIANDNGKLRDGMYADVDILASQGAAEIMVPLAAIQHDGDRTFLYIVSGSGYEKRTVHILSENSGYGVVDKGVGAKDRVVTHGALFLTESSGGG